MNKKKNRYLFLAIIFTSLFYSTAMATDYTDNRNGTVTDNRTKLIWQKKDDNSTRNWKSAISYCKDLSLAGKKDWRLPVIDDLESIVEETAQHPAINRAYFPNINTTFSYYWSSSTYTHDTNNAWIVYFYYGSVHSYKKDSYYYVRCVRGGE